MKEKTSFTITETTANGKPCYCIAGMLGAKRVRQYRGTMAEAVTAQTMLNAELHNLPAPSIVSTRLTPAQALDAERALHALPAGMTLEQCVRFTADNYTPALVPVTVSKALADMLADYERRGKRPDTIRNLSLRVGWLSKRYPDKLVSEVTADQIKGVIESGNGGPVSQDNTRRAISSLFTYCGKKKHTGKNPMDDIEPGEWDAPAPEAYSLAQVRGLLNAATGYRGGRLVPYVVLGLLCGIRPTEIARLATQPGGGWDAINLDARCIRLDERLCKLRDRRIVEFPTIETKPAKGKSPGVVVCSVVDWLAPHKLARTPIVQGNWRKDWDEVKLRAGIDGTKKNPVPGKAHSIPDGLRHTAISNHLAQFENEGKTATWAGNSPSIIHANYKALTSQAEAREFWTITPANIGGVVVPLPVGKAVAA